MSTATVRTGTDTLASSQNPSSNYASWKYLAVRNPGTVTNYSYLWLKSPVQLGATVISATLRLHGVGAWASSTVSVQPISAAWSVGQTNWNNKPGVAGSIVSLTQANAADGSEWAFDVTALVQSMANGTANYGFRVSTTSTTQRLFYSLDAPTFRPTLEVTWSDAPNQPHTLSPSGGRAVSIAKPIVRCDYVDVSGALVMQSIQVQIDAAANWAAPGFDSGTVASAVPELDLAATAYAGLAAGATTQWRVRVQDAASLWSAWSDAASFARTAKGTVTITNPAVAPNDYVTEWTPPIIWSVAGATQRAWQVSVVAEASPSVVLHNTGMVVGTATSYTLPARVLTDKTARYIVTVVVWDTAGREATPGDPPYIYAQRSFSFSEDATTSPVTGLTAAQAIAERPPVMLEWDRATAPDSYAIVRDGRYVASGILPADVLVSGTHYQWAGADAPPNVAHTWIVQAVVNGKASASNPTVTLTAYSQAAWLVDADSDLMVPIIDQGGVKASFAMPETASVLEPVGSNSVVRIVQTQRGLEGSVSGVLVDFAAGTTDEWAAVMLAFKTTPNRDLRLVIRTTSLRVQIGNVVVAPLVGTDVDGRAVSFDFWSQDGPA